MPQTKIERRRIADLLPAKYNPRRISKTARAALKSSIERFGMVQPIVVNERTGLVIGGHQRLQILRERGDVDVDVVLVDLSPTEEKALNVALNSQHLAGEFDDTLADLLSEIQGANVELFADLSLELLQPISFDDAPDSVQANVDRMSLIKSQRKRGNDAVIEKTDTERYLVIVCKDRAEREGFVKALGLPSDERYVPASVVEIRAKVPIATTPVQKAAPRNKAGATG